MLNGVNSGLAKNRNSKFFYGYIIVSAAFCIQMIAWGMFSTYGVFFKPLTMEFGWTRATTSGAYSLSWLVYGLLGIGMGRLSDRFGPRMIMIVCGFFLGLGYFLMSQINTIWQLYLFYGVVIGIGVSAIDVSLLSTVARWFVKKRGMMSGIVKVGTGVGMLIMPIVAIWLISSRGWRTSYIIIGIITLVFVIVAAQFLRRDPGQMRQLPNGEKGTNAGSFNSADAGLSLQEAIHTRQFWVICGIYFALRFCTQGIMVHIVPHATDLGISMTNAASVLAAIGGVSIVGRFVLGSAGDRIGNKLAMIICFLILVVALFWLQFAKELWMLYLFVAIYGIAHGGFFALISPMVAELFGTGSHGVIFGIVLFSGAIGGGIGSVLAGHIFDITTPHSYQLAFLIFAGVSIIGLILCFLLRPIINKGGEK